MTNLTDLTVDSVTVGTQDPLVPTSQALVADGAISLKHGVVTLDKAGVLAATLADPVATTDDFKELVITALSAQAHTVASASAFGGGAADKVKATYGGAVGDTLHLLAYGGKWYVVEAFGVTLGVA